MHSEFSSDSDTPMEDMIVRSIDLGLKQICFTDHMDLDFPKICYKLNEDGQKIFLDFIFDPNEYFKKLTDFREKYKNQIEIGIGIELGLQPHIKDGVKKLMNDYNFDFAIGSMHLLYQNDPYYESFWTQATNRIKTINPDVSDEFIIQSVLRDYFEAILESIKSFPYFQVYGHLDYIVRYAPKKDTYYHPNDYKDLIDEILKQLIASNRGIEINTSGLKSGLTYANPHMDILKRYKELGGSIITVGSDAHSPEYVAYQFERAREFLLEAGFEYYTTFMNKEAKFHRL